MVRTIFISRFHHWSAINSMFWVILLFCLCCVSNPLPFPEKIDGDSYKFLSQNSFQTYKSRTWLENDIMQISFQFQSRVINGQLAAVSLVYYNGETSSTNENVELNFDLFIKNSLIHARFGRKDEHRRTHLILTADASNGRTHKVDLTINPTEKEIFLTIDDEIQTYSYRNLESQLTTNSGEMSIVFGYSGKETGHVDIGFVGCISNIVAKLNDKKFHVDSFQQIDNGCSDLCSIDNQCPTKTDCVNFYSDYKCDCYRYGKEGVDCSEDLSVVNLGGTNGIRFDVDNSRIRRIGMAFKTFVDSEQVLFDGHLNRMIGSRGRLTAQLTNSQKISITINGTEHLYEIGADNFADGIWHFVTIEINVGTKSVDVKVDDFGWMSIGLKSIELNFHNKNPYVSFGGLLNEEENEKNFQGCFKELYINYDSVLYSVKRHQSKDSDGRRVTFGCSRSQMLHPYQPVIYANQEIEPLSIDEGSAAVDQENAVLPMVDSPTVVENVEVSPEYEENQQPQEDKLNYDDDNLTTEEPKQAENLPMFRAGSESEASEPETTTEQPKTDDDGEKWHNVFGNQDKSEADPPTESPKHETVDTKEHHHVQPVNYNVHEDMDLQPTTIAATLRPRRTCESLDCGQKGVCHEDPIEDAKCICNEGFVGKTCLFSNLPRSCDELFNMGERRSGVYRIDPVGSEDQSFAYVRCEMEQTTPRGITIVDHNFPNSTLVRSKNMTDTTFTVSYKFMTEKALKHLIDGSLSCKQHIRYDCNQAPLQFMRSATFFESPHKSGHPFARIGTFKGSCPCGANSPSTCTGYTKSPNNTCNCDSSDQQSLFDEGDMVDDFAAITNLTFLQFKDRESVGRLSLGALICEGSKGYNDVVQFRNNYAYLTLPPWKGHSLSFWFRTSNGDNTLVSQYSNDGSHYMKVATVQAHILDVKFNFGASDHRVEVPSQKPVNDSRWHKVLIESINGHLRFSLDDQNSFHKLSDNENLDQKTFTENFYIGSNPKHADGTGFIGCIRQFIQDDYIVDIDQLLIDQNISQSNIAATCQDKCVGKPCKNNAECVEDYENNSHKCQCVNPRIHLGNDCQTDINEGSDVSFHNPTKSFINLTNLPENPVTQDIVFSFKTDQTDALLMYAHDENYNFIQVHLSSGNKISMTANFETNIRQCTITRPDKEFDTMEWIQIIIDYETDYLALYADKLFCRIEGRRTLSSFYIESWESTDDVQNVVVPPRSPFKPKDPSSVDHNTILFVGGVPNLGVIGKRNKRETFYQTYVPNLLGAIRGLRVGENTVNLQQDGKKSGPSVKLGSNFGCEKLNCENGGVCNVAWMTPNEKASCDCSMTSFAGADCADDNGVNFDGKSFVSFDMKGYFETLYLNPDRSYDNLRFTFSSAPSTDDAPSQVLVDLMFNDNNELKLTLNRQKGHLHVALTDVALGGIKGFDIGGSYADGTRHFVYVKFTTGKILIRVDQQHRETKSSLNLEKLETAYFGGAPESRLTPNEQTKVHNYTGCMSNAVIEFTTARAVTITPLVIATDPEHRLKEYVKVEPAGTELSASKCADFAAIAPSETVANIDVMPEWNVPLTQKEYIRIVPIPDPAGDGGGNYGVAIALIILLLVILLVLGVFLYFKKCRKPKQPTPTPLPSGKVDPSGKVVEPSHTKEETHPLIHGDSEKPGQINTGRHSHKGKIDPLQGELPEADEDLDKFGPLNEQVYNKGFDPVRTQQ